MRLVGSGMPPIIDLEAIHVHRNTVEHPHEDVEQSRTSAAYPIKRSCFYRDAAEDVSTDRHGQKRADDETQADSPKKTWFADKGFSMLETTCLADDTAAGESVPKTPKLDKSPDKGHQSQVTSTDLSLYEMKQFHVLAEMMNWMNLTLRLSRLTGNPTFDKNGGSHWCNTNAIRCQTVFPPGLLGRGVKNCTQMGGRFGCGDLVLLRANLHGWTANEPFYFLLQIQLLPGYCQ